MNTYHPPLIPSLSKITNFSAKYFIPSKVYTDHGGIKYFYHSLSACTENNSLAKSRGLSYGIARIDTISSTSDINS